MRVDDGPTNGQSHSHATRLRCEETIKDALPILWLDSGPGVFNREA
jgi:hypothetical protein